MSTNENRTPTYKLQFTLTVLSEKRISDQIKQEIDKAIGERVNYRKHGHTFDNISHTHRYIFTFSPVASDACKSRIQGLAHKYSETLIIFFDQNKTFGIRILLDQIQKTFDFIMGMLLPTTVTIIFRLDDVQERKNIQKSLSRIFFNGNNTKVELNDLKTSKEWYKTTFKVTQPIKFKNNFQDFKNENKGLVVFQDLTRKKKTSYIPYTGFLSLLLNIVYFRDLLLSYLDQLIMACYNLIQL